MDPGPHMRVEVFRIAELISGEIVKVELAIVRDKELHTSGWTEFQRIGTVIVDVVRSQETGRDLEPAIGGVCQTGPLYWKGRRPARTNALGWRSTTGTAKFQVSFAPSQLSILRIF